MGQGYSLTTLSAGAAGIDTPELADLAYERSLGNARFMKSVRARHKDGLVVAKVVMKPYQSLRLDKYVRALLEERATLAEVPNALPYHRILETGSNGYLVRQYIHSSLYDRMSTRPFLENIEKRWLSFQLLCAVRDCHAGGLYHGDIKTENCLVTSWNWLYLCDFSSSFKPTYLPSDNPADFSFYFDTSGRRTCYLAPERFLDPSERADGGITWAMDIFSVGCVIAELFLETPIFSLSQLFRYKNKEFEPAHTILGRIEDHDIREMVIHMINRDPEDRYSAEEYLNFWRQRSFPEYFYSFLHQYMFLITDPSSGQAPATAGKDNLGEADDRIDRVYLDFDKIAYFLGLEDSITKPTKQRRAARELFPLRVDIPDNEHDATSALSRTADDGTLIFLQLVVSSLRNTARAAARIRACELLLAFAERLTDEAKLDRVLPYLMFLLEKDTSVTVKVAALRTATQLLALISVVSPSNANIFPDYITKRLTLSELGNLSESGARKRLRASPVVRATYAQCLALLATTSSRYLNLVQGLRADGSLPTNDPETEDGLLSYSRYQGLYDTTRTILVQHFETETKALLQDDDASVRRAFLGSIGPLCVFFGSEKASDVVLTHLNTYLNDRDWMLKCAFFETIVGVATFVGGPTFEEFILPLMVQAMTDPEEFVVERVLRSLALIAELGLFQRSRTWELVDVVARFTMHPNAWIREAAVHFIASSTKYLCVADRHGIIVPLARVYLRSLPADLTELSILESLKRPLPRLILDMASLWAAKAEKGLFWKQAQKQRAFSFSAEDATPNISDRDLTPKALSKVQRNEDDELWLNRLRNAGMEADDDFKLLVLREYIWKVARRRDQEGTGSKPAGLNGIVMLKNLNLTPHTVLFTEDIAAYRGLESAKKQHDSSPRTIAEAILDASTTVDDALMKRKGSNIDRILQQEGLPPRSRPLSPTQTPPIENMSTILGTSPKEPRVHGSAKVQNDQDNDDAAGGLEEITSTGEHSHQLRHRDSAMTLLGRGDAGNKALAELGTSPANAVGKFDGTYNRGRQTPRGSPVPTTKAPQERQEASTAPHYRAPHTYTGDDPTVLRLLDSIYIENYPTDYMDFGPQVAPLQQRHPIKRNATQPQASPWKPEGTLIAALGEHTGGVNRVAVSSDSSFFVTGSDDGSVKVWDSSRLERNIAHRSRQTHRHTAEARVTSLCFVENTHCFISTATDGSVTAVRVQLEEGQGSGAMPRYSRLKVVRDYSLRSGQYVVWCEHFKADDGSSTLLMATNDSHIIGLDLRSMKVLYDLQNPLNHGTPTCFCVDRKHHWVLVATSHGVLDLWDLRFGLRLKAWRVHGGAPIHRVSLVPVRHGPKKNRICIAGGTGAGEVTIWELEKTQCREVYRADTGNTKEAQSSYKLVEIEDNKAGGMLERFATGAEAASGGHVANTDQGVRAVTTGLHIPDDGGEARQFFMLSAGPDWRVRFWDTSRYEYSGLVSGPTDERATHTIMQRAPDVVIVEEHLQRLGEAGTAATSKNSKQGKGQPRTSTRSLVSMQTQNLMKSHLDQILDVALLALPYGMVISVDRAGMIYVFA